MSKVNTQLVTLVFVYLVFLFDAITILPLFATPLKERAGKFKYLSSWEYILASLILNGTATILSYNLRGIHG